MFGLKHKSLENILSEKNSRDISPNSFYLLIGMGSLIVSFLVAVTVLAISKLLPPRLPLFYSLPWGDSQLVTKQQFFILPAIIAIVTLVNLGILWQLHSSQSFFKNILIAQSILVSIILTIAFIKIILTFI